MRKLAISAIGKDQPGIVSGVTQVLYDTHCNVEDTSMTILEDQFMMLFIVHAPMDVTAEDLKARFKTVMADFDLHLDIHDIETSRENMEAAGTPWMISVSGSDQTGIMYHVTQYLSQKRINIRHLSSKRITSAEGQTLFLMAIEADVPKGVNESELQADLRRLGQGEQLEIHAEALEVYTL